MRHGSVSVGEGSGVSGFAVGAGDPAELALELAELLDELQLELLDDSLSAHDEELEALWAGSRFSEVTASAPKS